MLWLLTSFARVSFIASSICSSKQTAGFRPVGTPNCFTGYVLFARYNGAPCLDREFFSVRAWHEMRQVATEINGKENVVVVVASSPSSFSSPPPLLLLFFFLLWLMLITMLRLLSLLVLVVVFLSFFGGVGWGWGRGLERVDFFPWSLSVWLYVLSSISCPR